MPSISKAENSLNYTREEMVLGDHKSTIFRVGPLSDTTKYWVLDGDCFNVMGRFEFLMLTMTKAGTHIAISRKPSRDEEVQMKNLRNQISSQGFELADIKQKNKT
jgi:hypothetical protein